MAVQGARSDLGAVLLDRHTAQAGARDDGQRSIVRALGIRPELTKVPPGAHKGSEGEAENL